MAQESPGPVAAYWEGSKTDVAHPKDPGTADLPRQADPIPPAKSAESEPESETAAPTTADPVSPNPEAAAAEPASPPSEFPGTSPDPTPTAESPAAESPAAEGGYPAYPGGVSAAGSAETDFASPASTPAAYAPPAVPAHRSRRATPLEEEAEDEEEEGGGPVKPFLDHLEDLRWTLLKVISSILLGTLVCLVASDKLVAFLMWPLKHAQRMLPASRQKIPLMLGTNELAKITLGSVGVPANLSNRVTALTLTPVPLGSNHVLALQYQTSDLPADWDPNMVVLKNYGPISAFMVALKLAVYGGLVIASPFVIFFIGQFVLPALKVREKAFIYRVAGFGSILFFAGLAFCYLLIVQVALMASVQFSQWMGFGADEWRAEDYVSFVSKFMLGMGLSFQLPLVILTMVKVGFVDHEMLAKYRAYFIVGNLIVSAVVTPSGDPLTMVLMALPLQLLYEGSLLIARRWARQEREREAAEG